MGVVLGERECFDVCVSHPEREVVGAERAEALLAPLGDRDLEAIRHVKLSNKSYTIEAAECVAAKLGDLFSVTSVDVSDVIAGRPEAEALRVLSRLAAAFASRRLTAVDVSDNALGQKGIDALLPLLEAQRLKSLRICNNGMSAAAAEQLASLVEAADLETFHYHNNMSGDEGAAAVARIVERAPNLKDFRFSGTRAGRDGSLAVARSLEKLENLEKLDLVDNTLALSGGAAVASFISTRAPPLHTLDLRDCSLGDDGFKPIAEALEALGELTHLDVSGNELTPASVGFLPVTVVQRLLTLALEDNEIQNAGSRNLATLLLRARPARLRALLASTNEITSTGALTLARAIAVACPGLAKLDLDGNGLSTDALDQLPEILGEGVVLGPMDDNDEEAEEEEKEEEDAEVEALIAATEKHLSTTTTTTTTK
ncbi:hypothetical protein CTAYLR_001576 [Chrysophaeum taylorii]|uniref:Uncharacterized protein n=1 Tax=Chrysophaeum taylorii TaxID=2483200 RepID=A0AAD7UFC9_9STRA|nr:hypothetical protein CTAYLR_001576 [Chrysophaeum taylorii]